MVLQIRLLEWRWRSFTDEVISEELLLFVEHFIAAITAREQKCDDNTFQISRADLPERQPSYQIHHYRQLEGISDSAEQACPLECVEVRGYHSWTRYTSDITVVFL